MTKLNLIALAILLIVFTSSGQTLSKPNSEQVTDTVSRTSLHKDTVTVVNPLSEVVTIKIWNGNHLTYTQSFSSDTLAQQQSKVLIIDSGGPWHKDFQVSIVPFIGTNHMLSARTNNDYSYNVFGGISMGTNKAEFGGFFNIDRGDVHYAQFAGVFNLVGGRTSGIQAAGLINLNRRKVTAAQFAGWMNANLDSVQGAQFAGIGNVNGRASEGAQFAGIFNVQLGSYNGSQFTGLINVTTHQIRGTQVAGLVNYAHHIKGVQVGLFNYADSIQGIPLGLFSFVSHGYHKIELSADEIFYTNLSFRTGVRQFYNILNFGLKPETWNNSTASPNLDHSVWTYGYGIGTSPKITKWMFLNLDLTSNHINKGNFTNSLSLLNKIYMGLDFQILKKLSVTAGVTLNAYLTDTTKADNPVLFTNYSPRIFSDHNFSNGTNMKMWWGAKVGIRFL